MNEENILDRAEREFEVGGVVPNQVGRELIAYARQLRNDWVEAMQRSGRLVAERDQLQAQVAALRSVLAEAKHELYATANMLTWSVK